MFNYTITDGDGDTSPSTLTINVANATVLAPTDSDVTVNENALDTTITGSDLAAGTITGSLGTASPAETDASNQLDGSGGFGTLTYALVSGGNAATAGTFGTIQVHADGSYVYTLTSPVTEPTANNGADTVNAAESFTYVVTDAVGNSATGTININIVDDVPTATADVNSAGSGQTVTGNVETNDTAGADGIASIAWAGAVGSTVTGAHGTLTVGTDGSYSYHANPNTSGTDVFNYTITDGDGDTSPSTLTINVANATVLAPTDSDVTVNENALDTTITGSDLAAGTITGSLGTASPAETDASNQLDGSGGFGTLTYALVSGGNAATAGTFGTIQVHADGSYVYTLTSPVTEPTANNGADTVNAAESFTYVVTDAVGNSATGTININIVDDVPTAPTVTASAATVGVDETPAVQITGGANDVLGSSAITFNGAANTVAGLFSAVVNKGTDPDVPVASLDNGALSFASSGASSIVTVTGGAFGADGAGTTTSALSVTNAASGLTLTDGTAITLSLVDGRVIGTVGNDAANAGLSGKVAFAIALDPLTGQVYVAQYLSLHQDSATNTPNDLLSLAAGSVGVTVRLTDGDGDQVTSTADISTHINFLDDGPTAPTVTVSAATVGVDETPAVQITGGASDVAGSSAITFNGAATTVAGLFSAVANKGTDPDVPVASLDNGALSFASSGASSIVTVTGGAFGADGAGTTTSALSVTNAASGLTLTDGTAITLSLVDGRVIGTVGNDVANAGLSGKVAFAIALDPLTGQVYVAQYLSLHQDSATNTPNDLLSLAAGSVGVTVRLTDGDGDQVTSTADISTHINFLDDGPTAPTVTVSAATVGVDETPAVQITGGASDVAGSSAITFNGAATTVAGLFSAVANKGTDPDVPVASLDNGALSFASSGASSIVTVTGGAFGADGAGTTTSALSVTNAASGLTLTDGTAITLSLVDGRVIGTVGNDVANAGLSGKVAFAIALDPLTGQVYVAQYLSLHQDSATNTPNDLLSLAAGSVGVTVRLTDGDGDQVTSTADISTHINFLDDGPTAPTVTVSAATVGVDETPAVQITGGASDVAGSSAITFNGAATTVAGLFSAVANKGTDPDVPVASLDNGALSFASSGASSIVTVTGGAFGADGAGTTTSALSVTNAASGLTLTDGTAITLSLVDGRVIGTVGDDAANPSLSGKVAFAIALDPLTGQVYVAQYLSLHQDSATNTPNDLLSLAAGSVGVTVTLTDGDGDQVTSTADISTHINFLDDGPTAPTVTVSAATVGVDETPAVQTTGGASDVRARARSRSTVQRPRLRGCSARLPTRAPIPMFPLLRWTMAR